MTTSAHDDLDGPTNHRPRRTRGYVLIAEHNSRLAEAVASLVLTHGFDPVIVRDVEAAIVAFAEHGLPAVAVINLSLPIVDGFAVLAALRYQAPATRVPAVVMSSMRPLRDEALEHRERYGIVAVLTLPLSIEHLAHALEEVFREHRRVAPVAVERYTATDRANDRAREAARLAELEHSELVDDLPPPTLLQHLLAGIAQQFGVSIALISLVTRDRQYFKAHYGLSGDLLEERGTSRASSFCRHVVEADHHEPLIVPNALENPLFADHPLVTSGMIGSYIGVPLVSPRGHVVGTLCLVDPGPWLGSAPLVDALVAHARAISMLLWPVNKPIAAIRLVRVRIPTRQPTRITEMSARSAHHR
ncbi:MAG: GAF domain-containing protein [Proteobacteria bacterium]|nr:GAF domain-containing protein [Pseudomonadota bacterium]